MSDVGAGLIGCLPSRFRSRSGGYGVDVALINCPECGHEVSSSAASCPNCGYPIKFEGADLVRALQARQATVDERIPRWKWARIANFRSRTRRSEFWTSYAIIIYAALLPGLFYSQVSSMRELERSSGWEIGIVVAWYVVWFAVAIWLGLGSQVNRLHDMGYSGWLVLLSGIPLVGFGMLIWMGTQPGRPGPNQWGPPVA
jgi:uncharacterized membrane protein YhaH (DUF805 family)